MTDPAVLPSEPDAILDRLRALRAADAPTHGGHILSYVYDPDRRDLDDLAARAIREVQSVNGLDPTTFTSVAVMEREVVNFARGILHGDDTVVGSVTAGGTESCMLAVKMARDRFRSLHPQAQVCRVVAPVTAHAAFRKAAHYLDVELTLIPVSADGQVDADRMISAIDGKTALVVVSAPNYPFGAIDPIPTIAAAAEKLAVPVHVDACIGGWVLPFWQDAGGEAVPPFDFSVPGVTSISADTHKYGYSPKGLSVLLVRGRDLHRFQFFATTSWPGYPVVNATMAGSRSAGPLAAGWAIIHALGRSGYVDLTRRCVRAVSTLRSAIDAIAGLRIVGNPTGPLLAVAADDVAADQRVDPHVWADALRGLGFVVQAQPGVTQPDGVRLPHTAHLTVTPVTDRRTAQLCSAMTIAADSVRGAARPDPAVVAAALGRGSLSLDALGSDAIWDLLRQRLLGDASTTALPDQQAPLLALVEGLGPDIANRLLIELVARFSETDLRSPSQPSPR